MNRSSEMDVKLKFGLKSFLTVVAILVLVLITVGVLTYVIPAGRYTVYTTDAALKDQPFYQYTEDESLNKQIVIDMGSTKEELCELIALHPHRARFVATHPMWGTEYSGPEAACEGAFEGCNLVLCEVERSDAEAVATIEDIYRKIGMNIMEMSAAQHDTHAAYVSHISHITSFILSTTVLEKERESETILNLAGGGFESTVRLAKSSAEMWLPIFRQNKYNILDVLREYIHQLEIFRKALERDNSEELRQTILRANEIRKILK